MTSFLLPPSVVGFSCFSSTWVRSSSDAGWVPTTGTSFQFHSILVSGIKSGCSNPNLSTDKQSRSAPRPPVPGSQMSEQNHYCHMWDCNCSYCTTPQKWFCSDIWLPDDRWPTPCGWHWLPLVIASCPHSRDQKGMCIYICTIVRGCWKCTATVYKPHVH